MATIYQFPERRRQDAPDPEGSGVADNSLAGEYEVDLSETAIAMLRAAAKARRTHPVFSRPVEGD